MQSAWHAVCFFFTSVFSCEFIHMYRKCLPLGAEPGRCPHLLKALLDSEPFETSRWKGLRIPLIGWTPKLGLVPFWSCLPGVGVRASL